MFRSQQLAIAGTVRGVVVAGTGDRRFRRRLEAVARGHSRGGRNGGRSTASTQTAGTPA